MRIAVLALAIAPAVLAAQTARDTTVASAAGTAVISGVVVSDDASATPVRRVVIAVSAPEQRGDRRTVTDDQGRFSIGQLPAGHYTITATKAGWLAAYYGSSRPGRPAFGGASLAVTAGEHAAPVTLKLLKGSVVTGVVTDAYGRPAAGMELELATLRVQDGERRLGTQNFTGVQGSVSAETDDRGAYRFYGVAPGDYVLVAMPGFMDTGNSEVLELTPEALAAARRSVASATPGGSSAASNAATGQRPPTIGASPVFYPGTVDVAGATVLRIGPNEERSGIDLVVHLVATSRVQGVVMGPDGQPAVNALVQLLPPNNDTIFFGNSSTRTGADGTFKFVGVQPGAYEAVARGSDPAGAGRRGGGAGTSDAMIADGSVIFFNGPAQTTMWASQPLTVAGQDIPGLTLTLERGATVSGRITFTGTSLQTPQDLSRTRVTLQPAAGNSRMALGGSTTTADASGAFHVSNVAPGRYRVNVVLAGAGPGRAGGGGRGVGAGAAPGVAVPVTGWFLRSAMSGDVDAVDHAIDVSAGATLPDLVVTFTDHLGEISGTVRKAGQPMTSDRVVVFSADKSVWGTSNRRMRAPVQTERDGTFRVENLPAGRYFLSVVTDMDPEDLTNLAFLDDLAKSAIPITLGEGERKVQDVNIK